MRVAMAVVLVGCGGAPQPRALANAGGPVLDVPLWRTVKQGAVFHLHDADEKRFVVTVDRDETTANKRVLHLAWSGGYGPVETIELTATTVRFTDPEREREASFPPGEIWVRPDGATCYIRRARGMGCIDHCSTRFCVHPAKGLVGGYGYDWPGEGMFRP